MKRRKPLPLGTKTQWGPIGAVLWTKGERYYMMYKKGTTSLLPADVVEDQSQ